MEVGAEAVGEQPSVEGGAEPRLLRAAGAEPGVAAGSSRCLLVAEDDAAIRSAVRRILARAGYDVVTATDGLEAARIAEARAAPFDLVLTDVIMPALTGPQLVARLRRRWPRQAVLFMSGYPEDALAEVPNFSVQRDFLAKPFTPAELVRRVGQATSGAASAATPASPDTPARAAPSSPAQTQTRT